MRKTIDFNKASISIKGSYFKGWQQSHTRLCTRRDHWQLHVYSNKKCLSKRKNTSDS